MRITYFIIPGHPLPRKQRAPKKTFNYHFKHETNLNVRARILSTKLRCRKPRFDFETFDDASRLRKAYAEKNWIVSEAFKLNSIKKSDESL